MDLEVIWVEREAKYFCKRGLTRFLKIRSDLPVGQFLHSCHCEERSGRRNPCLSCVEMDCFASFAMTGNPKPQPSLAVWFAGFIGRWKMFAGLSARLAFLQDVNNR